MINQANSLFPPPPDTADRTPERLDMADAEVLFYPAFLEPGWDDKKKKVDAEIAPLVQKASEEEPGSIALKKIARDRVRREEYARRWPPTSVSRLVDHIDHIVKLVGVDYVGVGSDFDGVQATLSDLASVEDLPNLELVGEPGEGRQVDRLGHRAGADETHPQGAVRHRCLLCALSHILNDCSLSCE